MEIREREYAAVQVETSEGLVGKAYCLTRNAPVAACVERLVAPVVTGREIDPVASWEACSRATVAIGRSGLVVRASVSSTSPSGTSLPRQQGCLSGGIWAQLLLRHLP